MNNFDNCLSTLSWLCLIWRRKVVWHDFQSVNVIIRFISVKRNFRTCMKIVRLNFWNEFCVAIQNLRVSVDHCQQENLWVKIWNEMESLFPALSNISFLWRVHFLAHASICPIRLVKLRGTVNFQCPERQYYISCTSDLGQYLCVYFYHSTGLTVFWVKELCYATSCCWSIIIQPVFWSY